MPDGRENLCLIFESMNEVGFDDLRGPENYEVLNKINQEFVNLMPCHGFSKPAAWRFFMISRFMVCRTSGRAGTAGDVFRSMEKMEL